jgi:Na+-translocating ferredoxin:NAD+ oxidoreductase RnfG subunit
MNDPRLIFLVTGAVPLVAYCNTYLTDDQAAGAFFPGQKLTRRTLELSAAERAKIDELSGEATPSARLVAWVGPGKEAMIVDQVLGKHELITYAVAISPDGSVKGIEVLEYRESYGHEIKKEEWRKQFAGKKTDAPIKLGRDILNISGATLSCAHVTAGVRRVLHTYDVIKSRI